MQFEGDYVAGDFVSSVFTRNDRDLVIDLDKQPDDGIEDKITIHDAYAGTETGETGFTISIEFGVEGGEFTAVADIWSAISLA